MKVSGLLRDVKIIQDTMTHLSNNLRKDITAQIGKTILTGGLGQ